MDLRRVLKEALSDSPDEAVSKGALDLRERFRKREGACRCAEDDFADGDRAMGPRATFIPEIRFVPLQLPLATKCQDCGRTDGHETNCRTVFGVPPDEEWPGIAPPTPYLSLRIPAFTDTEDDP